MLVTAIGKLWGFGGTVRIHSPAQCLYLVRAWEWGAALSWRAGSLTLGLPRTHGVNVTDHDPWPVQLLLEALNISIISIYPYIFQHLLTHLLCVRVMHSILIGDMINIDSILKSREITLLTNVCLVKAMVFPVVMYGCESWTIKRTEC